MYEGKFLKLCSGIFNLYSVIQEGDDWCYSIHVATPWLMKMSRVFITIISAMKVFLKLSYDHLSSTIKKNSVSNYSLVIGLYMCRSIFISLVSVVSDAHAKQKGVSWAYMYSVFQSKGNRCREDLSKGTMTCQSQRLRFSKRYDFLWYDLSGNDLLSILKDSHAYNFSYWVQHNTI